MLSAPSTAESFPTPWKGASRERPGSHFAAPPPGSRQQASGCAVATLLLAGGGLAGGLWAALHRRDQKPPPTQALSAAEFRHRASTPRAVVFEHCGASGSLWSGAKLRLRLDSPEAIATDAAATAQLAGRLAPATELVHLAGADVAALAGGAPEGMHRVLAELARSRQSIPGLRIVDAAQVPPEALDSPLLSVELRPGVGLLDLYGHPGHYTVEDQSLLRQSAPARRGKYNPQDLFSGRPDYVRRALGALLESTHEGLKLFVDGVEVCPAGEGGSLSGVGALEPALKRLGLAGGASDLQALLCAELQGEGSPLLAALLRAQCGAAGGSAPAAVRELRDVQRQHQLPQAPAEEVLEAALARGFWNLPADSSGMHTREREAERLLERARRELWHEGSASRKELEAEIRKFLFRYQLGLGASCPLLRVHIARPRDSPGEEALRQRGYTTAVGQPRLWVRLELDILEIPQA